MNKLKLILKSPYAMILVVIPIFLFISTKIEDEIEKKEELKEVSKVIIKPIIEVHKKIIKVNDIKEDKEYQKLINKIFYHDTELYKMGYKKTDMNYELLTQRINYYKKLVSEMNVDRYIQDKTDYKLIKKDYERLHRLVTYYDRTYKMYRKKGISRSWIYNEFEKKAFSDFEKKVAKLYRTSLSYHDVNSLTQYHFKDTNNSSKINTIGFLQRIKQKRNYIESKIITYEANKKSFDKILSIYEKLKKYYVGANHENN